MSGVGHSLPATGFNPYAEDHTNLATGAAPYYAAQNAYTTPLQPVINQNAEWQKRNKTLTVTS